jgi:Spy/CpxP family protein refolding chaperone
MKPIRPNVALIAGLCLALAVPLLAQMGRMGAMDRGCALPDLTPDQTAKMAKLTLEHQKALVPLQAALRTKRLELRQLVLDKADTKKIEAKIDEIAKAGADIQKACLAHRTAVNGLLTEEQKKAFEQRHAGLGCGSGLGRGAGCGGCGSPMMGPMGYGGGGGTGKALRGRRFSSGREI